MPQEGKQYTQKRPSYQGGFSLIELIVSLALFAIFVGGAISLIVGSYTSLRQAGFTTQAALTAQETFDSLYSLSRGAFNQLQEGTYTLDDSSGEWELSTNTSSGNDFDATITIENVDRDSNDDLTTTGTNDPHTRKITSNFSWDITEARSQSVQSVSYLTDWWSGVADDTSVTDFQAGTATDLEVTNANGGELQILSSFMEMGVVQNIDHNFTTVNLINTYENPVIVARHIQSNNSTPITTRIDNVTSTSFDIRLQEALTTDPALSADDVYYIVVEEGVWTFGDDGAQIEAGTLQTSKVVSRTGGYAPGDNVNFASSFSSSPVVLHQVMSYEDPAWITSYVRSQARVSNPPTATGFRTALQGAEVTTTHCGSCTDGETLGWIAIENGLDTTVNGSTVIETFITPDEVSGSVFTYPFANTLSDPYVVSAQQEMDGNNGGWAVIDNVTTTSVGLFVQEDQATDAEVAHTGETLGYIASDGSFTAELTRAGFPEPPMEVGMIEFTDAGAVMEVGQATVDSTSWTSVSFGNTQFQDPIVVALRYADDWSTTATYPTYTVRIDNVSSAGFDMILQDSDGATLTDSYTVNYIVVERGSWYIDGVKIEAGSSSTEQIGCRGGSTGAASCVSSNSWVDANYGLNNPNIQTFRHDFDAPPVVLHQVMSYNDSGWISSWVSNSSSRSTPPGVDDFHIALSGMQVTGTHGSGTAEEIGWIAIESGASGTIDGVDFETIVSTDSIRGRTNGCYNSSTFYNSTAFSNPITIASQMEMDGTDGGLAVLCDQASTYAGFYAEEDGTPSGFAHADETFGMITFDGTFAHEYAPSGSWTTVNLQEQYSGDQIVIVTPFELVDIPAAVIYDFAPPVSSRVSNVTANSFDVTLQNPNDDTIGHDGLAYYMVVEEGQWEMGNTMIEAHTFDTTTTGNHPALGSGVWVADAQTYDHTYVAAPVILHQVQSNNNNEWISTWASYPGDQRLVPDATDVQIGLAGAEATADTSIIQDETIGWIAIENSGLDSFGSASIETNIPGQLPQGHDEGCFSIPTSTTYTSTAIPIASQITMRGGDGGWIRGCDRDTTSFGWYVDEDQVRNIERSHLSREYMNLIIFDQPFVESGSINQGTFESQVFGPHTNFHILEWTQDTSSCTSQLCGVRLQVRSAENTTDLSSASWFGASGVGTYYDGDTSYLLSTDHIGDSYMQYRLELEGVPGETPIVEDVSLYYTE